MIAILAPERDVHAQAVAREISRRGAEAIILNTALGHEHSCQWRIGTASQLGTRDGRAVSMEDFTAIWLRRPFAALPPDYIRHPEDRAFARNEWRHLLDALLAESRAILVNRPEAEMTATKPRQLAAARRAGLSVPDTLISNDPESVLAFVTRHQGRVVHKALSAPRHMMLDTRRWNPQDTSFLTTLPVAPAIFQEEILGPFDVRAAIVGNRILAARFATHDSPLDSRLDLGAPCSAYELPSEVGNALLSCMKNLGLVFGAADFKVDSEGRFFS